MYRFAEGKIRHRMAPISRGFSEIVVVDPVIDRAGCHRAMRVMPW